MKLTVKTLKGGKFQVDAEPSNTVMEVKAIIEAEKSEFPAESMKLIHSGKVLKDNVTIESCNVKPNDFLVCMITKAKKKATPAPTPAPAAAAQESSSEAAAVSSTTTAPAPAPAAATPAVPSSATPATATSGTSATATTASSASSTDEFPAEVVANLTGMGFPEAEALACLRAAQGNPDVAVEFLTNGIPPSAQQLGEGAGAGAGAEPATGASDGAPLAALRNHPQFDQLRTLVQSNPASLQAVLTQIGEQQPDLLAEINANQPLFLRMMNEPVSSSSENNSSSSAPATGPGGSSGLGRMLGGGANPAQMAQMLSSMNPTELNEMATMMGLTPAQLTATAQMIGQMPPEQFQEFVTQAMNQEGMGAGALGGGAGGGLPRQHILRLTEEEMAAVDRLTEMGFDRSDAAQAFLACDKNEALAANLLMDSAGDFGGYGGNGGQGEGGGGGGADDTDDMYD